MQFVIVTFVMFILPKKKIESVNFKLLKYLELKKMTLTWNYFEDKVLKMSDELDC